jgi:hypothetical protein
MDTLEEYRQFIQEIISKYAMLFPSNADINNMVVVSEDRNQFLLMQEGWTHKKRIHHCLIHVQILNEKIWIHFDGTEDGITDELVTAGIPKDQIVLGFHPPYVRQHTDYAMA